MSINTLHLSALNQILHLMMMQSQMAAQCQKNMFSGLKFNLSLPGLSIRVLSSVINYLVPEKLVLIFWNEQNHHKIKNTGKCNDN